MALLPKKILAPITLVLLTFAACIKKSPPISSPTALTPLRWATHTPPAPSDWTECKNAECRRYADLVMEGLFRPDATQPGGVRPALAANVERVTDREYRIELRRNVRWSDGRELQAQDFVASWKKVLSKCRTNRSAKRLFAVTGAEGFCLRKNGFRKVGIRALGDHAIEVRLFRATPFFLRTLAHPVTWPRRFDVPRDTVPTLGPFLPSGANSFRRNSDYHSEPPRIESIEFVPVTSAEEGIGLYREGSVDVVDDISTQVAERLMNDPNLKLQATGEKHFLVLDPNHKPLQSAATRRALIESLDPEETRRLSQRPVLKTVTLNHELSEPRPSPRRDSTPERLESTRLTLSWDAGEPLAWLADAVRAQWNKNLRMEVDLQPQSRPGPAATRLVTWSENWFEPMLPSFFPYSTYPTPDPASALLQWTKVQQQWISRDALVRPLLERARALLKTPRLKTLPELPSGGWDYKAIEWG